MARNIRNPLLSPWAGALALGSVVVGLAAMSAHTPTRPWKEPVKPAPRVRVPLRPVAYTDRPVSIRPEEILALAGRRKPQSTFRVQLSEVLRDGALKVNSTSGLLVVDAEKHRLIAQVPGNTTYTVALAADGRALAGPGGGDLPSDVIRIQSISPDAPMETGERSFVGALEVRLGASGVDVINEVQQEDYITGVVAGEAARSFAMEALKAQAVAARTYAMSQRGHRGPDIDVVDTVADQVFTGAGRAWPEVRTAVNATAGQVMTYNGRPIVAYFSADCGGTTRTNMAAGLGRRALPYLKAVRDADANGRDYCATSPSHTWTRRLTETDIVPKLNEEMEPEFHTLTEIRFSTVYSDGRVGEVMVAGLGEPVEVPKPTASIRKPPANLVEPQPVITRPRPATDAPPEVPAGNKAETVEPSAKAAPAATPRAGKAAPAKDAISEPKAAPADTAAPAVKAAPVEKAKPMHDALTPGGGTAVPALADVIPDVEPEPEPEVVMETVQPEIRRFLKAMDFRRTVGLSIMRSQAMTVTADGEGAWLFSGRGYGHGVGMCQWGAHGRALAGIPYDRILKHYYSGIEIQPNAPRNGVLAGVATDEDGRPLADAAVTLIGTDRTVKTDAQGRFRFEALPAATYDIVVDPAEGPAVASFAWMVRPNQFTTAALKVV